MNEKSEAAPTAGRSTSVQVALCQLSCHYYNPIIVNSNNQSQRMSLWYGAVKWKGILKVFLVEIIFHLMRLFCKKRETEIRGQRSLLYSSSSHSFGVIPSVFIHCFIWTKSGKWSWLDSYWNISILSTNTNIWTSHRFQSGTSWERMNSIRCERVTASCPWGSWFRSVPLEQEGLLRGLVGN